METEVKNLSLGQMVDITLDRVPVFKRGLPSGDPLDDSRKNVLRSVFRPMVFNDLGKTLNTNGGTKQELKPEDILNSTIKDPDLKITPELAEELIKKYGLDKVEHATEWLSEVMAISLEGIKHPLNKLSQEVTGKLPEDIKRELTKAELT
ncbi:MAG: hypothetical protein HYW86_05000 [Candidatus Roizmanbacteria bacterium]|nr:MAG: hypothetical protein HYW86_05000 [Candidatus Roizmanbacteria bacterium]